MIERFIYIISKIYPKQARDEIQEALVFAGLDDDVRYWLARHTIIAVLLSFLMTFIFQYFTSIAYSVGLGVLTFGMYLVIQYLLVFYKLDHRAKTVDELLPSYLQFLAANLSSGLTPFQAVKASNKPEFGVLHDEMDWAVNVSLGAMPFSEALLQLPDRINSTAFRKFISLFVDGMQTGGRLARLLGDLSTDILENMDLKKEISTQSKSYVLFVVFTVLVGAPLLSSVSVHFLRTVAFIRTQANFDNMVIPEMAGVLGDLALNAEFLKSITTVNIAITATIASYLIAIIRDGKDKYLFKYAVFMIPISVTLFYALDYVLANYL